MNVYTVFLLMATNKRYSPAEKPSWENIQITGEYLFPEWQHSFQVNLSREQSVDNGPENKDSLQSDALNRRCDSRGSTEWSSGDFHAVNYILITYWFFWEKNLNFLILYLKKARGISSKINTRMNIATL